MHSKHRKILQAVFSVPVDGALEWHRIEALLRAIGCNVIEGSGSSVTFEKDGAKVFFHRPHPRRESLRYRIKDARAFLERIGITP